MLRGTPIFTLLALAGCSSGATVTPDAGNTVVVGVDAGADVPADAARDAGRMCGTYGACNLVNNQGCEPGMGCYATVRGTTLVSSCGAAGRRGWGEACTGTSSCREGFACIGNPAVCTKLCCGNDNSSCRDEARGGRPGAVCAGNITNTDMRFCIEVASCNPALATGNGCPAERPRCDVVSIDGTTNCSAAAAGVTPGRDGTPCCQHNACAVGLICVPPAPGAGGGACDPAAPNRVCRKVCNPVATGPAAMSQCNAGQQCAIRFNDTPETYGACTPLAMM